MVTIPLASYNVLTSKYGTEGVTLIGKREYDILLRKVEMYDKIKNVYEEGGNIEETLSGDAQNIPLPSLRGNTGDKSGGGDKLVVMMMITTHKMKMVAQEGLMTQRYKRKKWVDLRERKNLKIPS